MKPLDSDKLINIFVTLLLLISLSINLSHAAPGGSISGTVSDASDAPLSGVTVNLRNFAGNYVGATNTDASGNYTFTNLATDLY
jgi:hypothetical protein